MDKRCIFDKNKACDYLSAPHPELCGDCDNNTERINQEWGRWEDRENGGLIMEYKEGSEPGRLCPYCEGLGCKLCNYKGVK